MLLESEQPTKMTKQIKHQKKTKIYLKKQVKIFQTKKH